MRFEEVCKEFLLELDKKNKLPFRFNRIGKWWHKDEEIDLIALDEKQIIFCECKWQDKVDGKKFCMN